MALKGGPAHIDIGSFITTRRHTWEVVGYGPSFVDTTQLLVVCIDCDKRDFIEVHTWRVIPLSGAEPPGGNSAPD